MCGCQQCYSKKSYIYAFWRKFFDVPCCPNVYFAGKLKKIPDAWIWMVLWFRIKNVSCCCLQCTLYKKSRGAIYITSVSDVLSVLTVKLYWRQKLAKRFSADDSLPVAVTSFGIVGGILLLLAVAVMHYGSTAVYIERWDASWRTAAPQAHRQKSSANNLTIVILCSASITRFAFRYDTLLGSRKCRIE